MRKLKIIGTALILAVILYGLAMPTVSVGSRGSYLVASAANPSMKDLIVTNTTTGLVAASTAVFPSMNVIGCDGLTLSIADTTEQPLTATALAAMKILLISAPDKYEPTSTMWAQAAVDLAITPLTAEINGTWNSGCKATLASSTTCEAGITKGGPAFTHIKVYATGASSPAQTTRVSVQCVKRL
jgi:hypothetical protein